MQIFEIIKHLRNAWHGIIYISHRMEEVFQISDRVTILKDRKYVDALNTKDTNENDIALLKPEIESCDIFLTQLEVNIDAIEKVIKIKKLLCLTVHL